MAVSADIYRERSGNVTKIATNVTPPFTDSDSQEGDKYYVVPTGEQPVVLEIPPNISSFSVSNPSGQDVQITFDSDEQLGTNASDLSVQISGAESDVMARSDFTESGTGPYTYTGTYAGSSDGSYTATLQVAKDPRGNDGATGESDSVSFGTDSTPPTISNFSAANPSGQDVEVSFDSDEQLGSSSGDIDVGISGAESGSLSRGDFTESGTGPYTYTATYAGASDGDYTATLNAAKDSAGNDGASGQSSTVSVDTTAPSISSFSASNPSGQDVEVSFDSDEQLGGSAGDIDVGISGAESGSLARGDFSESGTGPYTYTATYAGSTDGDYTATLNTAQDSAGNDGASGQTSTVSVDTTAPTISSASLTNDGSGNLSFSFDSDEQLGSSNSDLAVSVDGPNTTDVYTFNRSDFSESGTGPYTYTLSATQAYGDGDGTYTAAVDDALDAAGNDGADGSQSDSYTFDSTAPNISSFSLSNPTGQDVEISFDSDEQLGSSSGDINVDISGAETASLGRSSFTESGTGPYTYTATYAGSSDGDYTGTLTSAKDASGNDGASSQSDTVSVDTTAPSITNVSLTNDGSGNLALSFDSDETLSSLSVTVDGPSTTDVYSFSLSDFSESTLTYTLSTTQAYSDGDGTYTATVDSAVDAAGNDGATGESDSYTLDTTAPTISNFTASNPSGQDVEVSFDADEQLGGSAGDIDVGISGAETASLARGDFSESGSGPYTYTATYTGSTDGDYTATLNAAKDPDGNDGASGQSDTVTVGQAATFQMDASTTEPTDSVDLTIPHTELSSGQTVSLFADNNDTNQDFTDDTNNSEYSLSYTPSASIGSEVDLQARVDSTTDASQVVTVTVEEAPDAISDLSLTSGDQQFDATWTVPDTVEGDVTSMEIHVSTSSMTDPQPGDSTLAKTVNSGFTEGNAITETVTGQTNGQQLYVQVLTIDADGFFAGSNEATVTPASGATASGEPVVASYDPAAQEVTWVSGDAPKNAAYDGSTQEVTWQFSPAISAFSATNPTAQDVEVSFESSTQLGSNASDLEVSIGGAETATLTRSDFTESGTGPYTYTATYSGSTSGEYTATLITATASDGSPLSSGQHDSTATTAVLSFSYTN